MVQHTHALRLISLVLDGETGAQRIANARKGINADAYEIEGGDVFMLYCPGRVTTDLPEPFPGWICVVRRLGESARCAAVLRALQRPGRYGVLLGHG